jgi:hypothetical protein
MPLFSSNTTKTAGRAAAKAYRAAGRAAASSTACKTDSDGERIWCRICGCKVRGAFGDVCSKGRCQQAAAMTLDSHSSNKPKMITSGRR